MPRLWLPFLLYNLGATTAGAQDAHSQFGFGIGRSIPTGAFRSDTTGQGFNGGWLLTGHATLRVPVLAPRFRLRIDATYAKHGANDQLKADLSTLFGQSADE